MTNKVAFINENDNDYHLDLQVEIKKILLFIIISNGSLYGRKLKINVYQENMHLNIHFQHLKIVKEILLD